MGTSLEIALWWMAQDSIAVKSTLAQVMAWCRQVTSNYLSHADQDLYHQMTSLGHKKLMCAKSAWMMTFSHWGPIMRTKFSWETMVMCSDSQVHFVISWGCNPLNTLRLKQNGWHFGDNIFKCIFMNDTRSVLFHISLQFVQGPIDDKSALV